MSVQLVVYPQNYEGLFSSISTPLFTEHVPDAQFTSGIVGNTYSTADINPAGDNFDNNSVMSVWGWWKSQGGAWGTPTDPLLTGGGSCTLYSDTDTLSNTGIYTIATGLQIGFQYDVTVTITSGSAGTLYIGSTNGISSSWTHAGVQYHSIPAHSSPVTGASVISYTFTASKSSLVVPVGYVNVGGQSVVISEVSIKENVVNAGSQSTFFDGQVICDLYDDESIPLTLSADNFKNVAEKTQSYSKAFSLPSTKRNNKIFTNLFDVSKSVSGDGLAFNPYRKTKAILKEDGYTIFDGFLKLIDIQDKEGEVSYNVNLYSDSVTLADTLKDKFIRDIDLSELNHDYNITNISGSFSNALPVSALPTGSFAGTAGATTTGVLKYPFCKWNGNMFVNSDGKLELTALEDAFRPWLQVKYLIDRIFSEAGFSYSSDFIDSADFKKLFMDFNWGAENSPKEEALTAYTVTAFSLITLSAGGIYQNLTYHLAQVYPTWTTCSLGTGTVSPSQLPTQYNTTSGVFTSDKDGLIVDVEYNRPFENLDTSSRTFYTRWVHKDSSGNEIAEYGTVLGDTIAASSVSSVYSGNFSIIMSSGDTLEQQIASDVADKIREYEATTALAALSQGTTYYLGQTAVTGNLTLKALRGEINQWDLIKDILTMFNLYVLEDKNNQSNLIIEPYTAVYLDDSQSQYITHKSISDWTAKVDISEHKLKPIELKRIVNFEYAEEDEDYARRVYKNATGSEFGSAKIDASDFTLLDGEEDIQLKIFSSTFTRPIDQSFIAANEMIVPMIYTSNDDGTQFEGFDNKPRILYDVTGNSPKSLTGGNYVIPAQNGGSANNSAILFSVFSHLTAVPVSSFNNEDFNFGSSQLIGVIGSPPVNNLYNVYWSPYYDELYNSDTREVSIKVFLTPADISKFEFFDKIIIRNREYRVNKIDYKPYELSKVELILLP